MREFLEELIFHLQFPDNQILPQQDEETEPEVEVPIPDEKPRCTISA
jgi:hypothetical protein